MPNQIYYCRPVFRPPSEAYSLLIQLTEGCTYKCDFCMSNLRKQFIVREIEDVKKDLDIAKQKYGSNVNKIFFLDGNAMVTPTEKLLEVTKYSFSLFCCIFESVMPAREAPPLVFELKPAIVTGY